MAQNKSQIDFHFNHKAMKSIIKIFNSFDSNL
jgi:hypothetical protein